MWAVRWLAARPPSRRPSCSASRSLVLNIALARWLGAAEFGSFTFVWSWVAVLGTVSVVGLDTTLVSRLPRYMANADWSNLNGLLVWAIRSTFTLSLAVLVLALAVRLVLEVAGRSSPVSIWLIAGALVTLTTTLRVAQSALRGLHRPAVSQLPDSVLIPTVMLGVVGFSAWTGSVGPTAEHALQGQLLAVGGALALAFGLLIRTIPERARMSAPRFEHRRWLMTSGRMFLLSTLTMVNGRIGILVLGVVIGNDHVGPYAVAQRGAAFVALALNVTVLAMAPTIVAVHNSGRLEPLQRLSGQMSRLALLGGIPVAVALVLWDERSSASPPAHRARSGRQRRPPGLRGRDRIGSGARRRLVAP
jgi:O-antigen/teichoic acid export membrane protein